MKGPLNILIKFFVLSICFLITIYICKNLDIKNKESFQIAESEKTKYYISNDQNIQKLKKHNPLHYINYVLNENSLTPTVENEKNILDSNSTIINSTITIGKIDIPNIINGSNIGAFDYDSLSKKHSKRFETNFLSSFLRSFSLSLVSEFMDKSFIIILYFSTKISPGKLLFFSGVSLIFMNSISILIGCSIPSLLYRPLIEWVALISFLFMSFAYITEAYHLEDDSHEKKLNKTIKLEQRTRLLERRNNSIKFNSENKNIDQEHIQVFKTDIDQMTKKETDSHAESEEDNEIDEKKIIYTLIYTILVAECGDRSQISSILLATVYNFSGVILGTTCALLITLLIAIYLGNYISKYISEKMLNCIASVIFFLFGLEIFLSKIGYN